MTDPFARTSRAHIRKQTLGSLGWVVVLAALPACSDLTSVPASLSTYADSGTVYALNGAPAAAPSALYVYSGALTSANASFAFDVAFDLSATGEIVVLPQRAVATSLASTHAVALATIDGTFETVTSAPTGLSFRADTALVVGLNQVVLIQVDESTNVCSASVAGTTLYAKLVIRSFDLDARSMRVEYVVNPNCGFRSFASGIPTS